MSTQYIDRNTLLLLHGETLADASWYKRQITNNGVAASAEQSKFGGKSLKFDGASYLLLDAYAFGDRDFTIDWWEYVTSENSHARFSSSYTLEAGKSPYGGLLVGYQGEKVYASSSPNENIWDLVSAQTMLSNTLNTWVHWALVRNGSILTSYRNGMAFATVPIEGAIGYSSSIQMAVGNYRFGDPSFFIGYIDEFRISSVARWTEDFTPPNERYAFTLITDRTAQDVNRTKLLAAKAWRDMTPDERVEWLSPSKGAYNYTDLNRVEEAVAYVAGRLREFGYLPDQPVIRYWSGEDIPNENDLSRYLRNVATLRGAIAVWASTPGAPNSTNGFGINEANALEQILVDVDQILTRISNTWFFLGDLFAAEV